MTPNYCSVCMPAVGDGIGGWCTDEFPFAISDQLRSGGSILKHMLRSEYHSCHIFRNVHFVSGDTIDIGECDCRLNREFLGDTSRNSLEFIMFEILNNSEKYSYSEFSEMVRQRLFLSRNFH